MNKKFLTLIGIGAIALVYALNLSYAMDNYGILKNTLSIDVLAQDTSSGKSSSGKGTGTGTGTSTNGGSNPWYLWPIDGTTKDEKTEEVSCTWEWEINLGFFSWKESGTGKKTKCHNGGSTNCQTGQCN